MLRLLSWASWAALAGGGLGTACESEELWSVEEPWSAGAEFDIGEGEVEGCGGLCQVWGDGEFSGEAGGLPCCSGGLCWYWGEGELLGDDGGVCCWLGGLCQLSGDGGGVCCGLGGLLSAWLGGGLEDPACRLGMWGSRHPACSLAETALVKRPDIHWQARLSWSASTRWCFASTGDEPALPVPGHLWPHARHCCCLSQVMLCLALCT